MVAQIWYGPEGDGHGYVVRESFEEVLALAAEAVLKVAPSAEAIGQAVAEALAVRFGPGTLVCSNEGPVEGEKVNEGAEADPIWVDAITGNPL